MPISTIATTPFDDQKPGTAGLRKKVAVIRQPHYLENFLQAIFNSVPELAGGTLVIGGDGRFHNAHAIKTAIAMAAANGVAQVIVGRDGLLSTPAASNLIRQRGATGGMIFTASHNPAGPDGDFGIKYNINNGGQASESITNNIHKSSQEIREYRIVENAQIDLQQDQQQLEGMAIAVVDPVTDYADLMEQLFDFQQIKAWLRQGHRICFDAMHAVTGPYATEILVRRLGAPPDSVLNATPLEDFGGGHPDPNLVYAKELVDRMFADGAPDFAAASDGDGDRNMILGPGIFISPGDSLAMLADHLAELPGYRKGLAGLARSMPTSRAVDAVAAARNLPCYETPTGWKFFANLLEVSRLTLCGEESFGTSSDHTREKDGLWAALAWINVLAHTGNSVPALATAHWQRYGRHYYQRHDYEDLPAEQAQAVMQTLNQRLAGLPGQQFGAWTVSNADDFSYVDPVDGSTATGQGLRVVFGEQARIVMRLSGTGTGGATLRLYLERYEADADKLDWHPEEALAPLAQVAEELSGLQATTGRQGPSLVT